MICENCGNIISTVEANMFDREGSDYWTHCQINEVPDNAVYIDLPTYWTGDELCEEEQADCIRCPRCRKFPFRNREIQTYTLVRCVMFKHEPKERI